MSHFLVGVLIPNDRIDAKAYVKAVLAPFDENTEVPEYDDACWCVGRAAEKAASDAADAECGTIDSHRITFAARHPEFVGVSPFDRAVEDAWKREVIFPRRRAEKIALDAHPAKDKADTDCDECKGVGTVKSTRNPQSKWDWWAIGGRWDDKWNGKPRAIVREVLAMGDDAIPFTILTPDGAWHAKGRMGWWGMVADEDESWKAKARSILADYPDHIIVGVDCHI